VKLRMGPRHGAVAAAIAATSLAISGVPAHAGPRGVIELFTSQGCSSCPPADRVLTELSHDSSIVALSLPVDYWDYLGWKDTLAKPRHSARQRGYASTRGDREVYTPQVVVNGAVHVLGSDKSAIERAIADTRHNPAVLSVAVNLALAGDKLSVNLPDSNPNSSAEVWLCTLSKAVPVVIGRGENHGRTITYSSVVRRWVKLGDWNGTVHSFTVPATEFASADSVAVIVQRGTPETPGPMLGAATLAVR
jgi:hypothetical protein